MGHRRIPREKRRYLKQESDRSGFDYFRRELVRDGRFWVHPDEKDEPPPTSKPIGGEKDGNADDLGTNRVSYPTLKSEIIDDAL